MNEGDPGRLREELTTDREALLAVVSGVEEHALTWPTRNPGWTVRDVLAHVLASDADLISLLEAAGRSSTHPVRHPSLEQHQKEMARWTDATPQMFVQQLRECSDRWRALLDGLPDPAFAIPVQVGGWSDRVRAVGDVVGDWRGHDRQHAEDVRLALADGPAGTSA